MKKPGRSRTPRGAADLLPPSLWALIGPKAGSGFTWAAFRQFFPFGNLSPSEAEYERLVLEVLDQLETLEERNRLMDLLDTQWCVFLEQLWVQCEWCGDDESRPVGQAHFAAARLQLNYNIRCDRGLRRRDARGAMLAMPRGETLLNRILRSPGSRVATVPTPQEPDAHG
jgi:hypothetical protein